MEDTRISWAAISKQIPATFRKNASRTMKSGIAPNVLYFRVWGNGGEEECVTAVFQEVTCHVIVTDALMSRDAAATLGCFRSLRLAVRDPALCLDPLQAILYPDSTQ